MNEKDFMNPFRPGAGHRPPYLAGRNTEKDEFRRIIEQEIIMQNLIVSGLRGVGKTVLLDNFRDTAQERKWIWVGTDCSESASVSEDTLAIRLLTDISLVTSNVIVKVDIKKEMGFTGEENRRVTYMDYNFLIQAYKSIPGLPIDKLKNIMLMVWDVVKEHSGMEGIIFAYDEAQSLSDHSEDKQYPLSLLLDLFQFLQKNGVRFILILTGLPTLLTKLVETRTYSERLFRVLTLEQLNVTESKEAILTPVQASPYKDKFTTAVVDTIVTSSGGYPYFIQYICREVYDIFEQGVPGTEKFVVPIDPIIRKLDNDFFAGRWLRATERERELLIILARLQANEFTTQQASNASENSEFKAFSAPYTNQLFKNLTENGLLYKNRRGSYSFAVPLLGQYILRSQIKTN